MARHTDIRHAALRVTRVMIKWSIRSGSHHDLQHPAGTREPTNSTRSLKTTYDYRGQERSTGTQQSRPSPGQPSPPRLTYTHARSRRGAVRNTLSGSFQNLQHPAGTRNPTTSARSLKTTYDHGGQGASRLAVRTQRSRPRPGPPPHRRRLST
jgi:hypothetical protein